MTALSIISWLAIGLLSAIFLRIKENRVMPIWLALILIGAGLFTFIAIWFVWFEDSKLCKWIRNFLAKEI